MRNLKRAAIVVWISWFGLAASWAQAQRSPFSVGAEQGGGHYGGITGWILAQQNAFYIALKADVLAAAHGGSAGWTLAGLSFAYGIFHAAGPGHGKAVVASYMLANEQALRRGLLLSLLAALLQGAVAVALVTMALWIFKVTAQRVNDAASLIEELSYVGMIALGLWLVWTKGRAFAAAWRERKGADAKLDRHDHARQHGHDHHGHDHHGQDHHGQDPSGHNHPAQETSHETLHQNLHVHDAHCGHYHAPDPATLGAGFSWRAALTTVLVAGARPCSGAILVLAFTVAQGIFAIGIWSVLAMSLGTALTTGALAAMAVLAKGAARHFTRNDTGLAQRVMAGLEFAAAFVVVLIGVGLLVGATLNQGGPLG